MGKTGHICFFILFSLMQLLGYGQEDIRIPAPTVRLQDQSLQISYKIVNSQPSERFDIELSVKDGEGNPVSAKSLSGDVGKGIPGGGNKSIYWDLETDQVAMNADIYINIYADPISPESAPGVRKMNRSALMIQSAAFPGLGLSRYTGKPHWIKGVAAYGCVGGAILLNRMAVSSYEEFLASESTEDAEAYFEKAGSQDQMSEVLAYCAIGIWVTDLVWTFIGTGSGGGMKIRNGISLNTGVDRISGAPLLGLKYSF